MRQVMLAAAVAGAVFALASPAQRAEAMPMAAPAQFGQAAAPAIEKAAIVCGYYGCRRVWPRYYYGPRPYWRGYYRRPYWGWRRGWRRW